MNTRKNIDRLFQEKFKDFEIAPDDALWNRINESLPNKKKKRRVIAIWWQIGGVAAVIALLLTVGASVFNNDDNTNQNLPVVHSDKSDSENNKTEDDVETSQDELKHNNDSKHEIVDSKDPSKLEYQNKNKLKKSFTSDELTTPRKSQKSTVANNSSQKEETSTSQKFNNLNTPNNNANGTRVALNANRSNKSSRQTKDTKLESEATLKSVIEKTLENEKTASISNSVSNGSETKRFKIKNTESISKDENNSDAKIIEDSEKETIQDALAEQIEAVDEKEDNQNRWSIAPNIAPVYYGSLGKGSSLDQQFNENAKSSDVNMSYGITGAYAVSKKLKIRAGINRINLNQSTSNVFAFSGPEESGRNSLEGQPASNITLNNEQNILLMSSNMLGISSAPETFNSQTSGDLDQRIGFIEVPLELEYQLIDNKLGINIIGGFSTFFLNENEIFADIDGASTLIGEANNINSTSFSANFGFGLDYNLSKQWNINLEPQFKYQINTFNNTSGDFRPFLIGVYTGLSFKF